MTRRTVVGALAAGLILPRGASATTAGRIVSIGGSVTEILFALGGGGRIVAVDTTSRYPSEAEALPDVGYMRALSAEGVLSTNPDLVLMEADAGPREAVDIIEASGIPVVRVVDDPSPRGIDAKIRAVAAATDLDGEPLVTRVESGFADLALDIGGLAERRRVLFVLSLANGRITAAGRGTSANAVIDLAGAENALDGVEGYKPIADEAVIAAAPDVVLVMDRGHPIGPDEVFALPAFATTPAAADRALISMDALYLLGFGPRTPDAARDLAAALYPGMIAATTASVR